MTHEVYIVRHKDDVLYIGEGKKGRSEHVHSGVSNVYTLNKLHFAGVLVDLEIIECTSKEDSKSIEKELITSMNPLYNTEHSKREHALKGLRRELKVFDQEHLPQLNDNTTYGLIKASIRNMSHELTSLVTPTDVRIACPEVTGYNGIASMMTRYSNNPTSKIHWFVEDFKRTETNGIYQIEVKDTLLVPDTLTSYLRRAFINKGKS